MQWNRAGGKAHAYGYLYDEVNRITGADYRLREAGSWSATPGNFSVDQVKYDQNGNIEKLKRYGELEERQYLLDDMSYTYQGNRLQAVQDVGEAQFGFVDGDNAEIEYSYDLSGNLIKDENKGISEIKYDAVLNLPEEVVITEKGTINYSYDAQGMKLRQEVVPSDGSEKKTTDYVQGFHYENGKLSFLQHAEGRLMMEDKAYHYDLKDHLGNSRVTFSSKPVTTTSMASMEMSAAPEEEAVFEGVAESRQTLAFHNTTDPSIAEPAPQQVATLMPGEQGPSKSLQVHSGDTVRLKVNARYETTPSQVQGLEGVATEVVGAVEKTASGLESSGVSEGVGGLGATGALANDQQEAPQAHLNYLVYDEDYQLIDQGFVAVSEAAAVGKNNPEAAPEELALEVPIEEDGFVYAYLSNGVANSGTPVHFDDFTVEQQSYIVQVSDFYPFGLTHQQPLVQPLNNRFIFSGKERQTDLGLNWDSFGARQYMSDLGRFTSIDRFAEKYYAHTSYHYTLNNPINAIDINGDSTILIGWNRWVSNFNNNFLGTVTSRASNPSLLIGDLNQSASNLAQTAADVTFLSNLMGRENQTANALGAGLNTLLDIPNMSKEQIGALVAATTTVVIQAMLEKKVPTAGSIRNVNKIGGTENCVNCVIATDATLAGNPASALNSIPQPISVLQREFGTTFTHNLGVNDISNLVSEPGQRGIIFGNRGYGEIGHVFNVVNQNGTVRFLDGQTGKTANLDGYKDFSFLPTNR